MFTSRLFGLPAWRLRGFQVHVYSFGCRAFSRSGAFAGVDRLRGASRPWTRSAEERLRALVAQGKPDAEIASLLDRNITAIRFKKQRMVTGNDSIRKMMWTQAENDTLLELYRAGRSMQEIMEQIPNRTLLAIRSHLAVIADSPSCPRRRFQEWTAGDDRTLRELYAQQLSWKAIAARMERSIKACISRHTRVDACPPSRRQRRWSSEEVERMLMLQADGTCIALIPHRA